MKPRPKATLGKPKARGRPKALKGRPRRLLRGRGLEHSVCWGVQCNLEIIVDYSYKGSCSN